MPTRSPATCPDKSGPNVLLIILGVVLALFAAVFVLRPKPPGAMASRPSPAATNSTTPAPRK